MSTAAENAALTGWRRARLKDLGTVVGGGTPSRTRPEYWEGPIPWASVKDFSDEKLFLEDTAEHISEAGLRNSASTLVPADTPVLCTRMAVGRCALTTRSIAINQDLKALLLHIDLDRRFFVRALGYHGRQLESVSIGSTVRGITLPDLLSLELCFPESRAEQTRIAAVLDAVDDAIAKTEAVIAKLKRVRAGLMHDLLTRGLDDNGELRDPIAHPEQFKDSPLGRIPRDWEVIKLGACSSRVTSGPRGWAAYYCDEGPVFLRVGNLTREHVNLQLDDVVHVRPPSGEETLRARVAAGDILISITADLGIVGVVPDWLGEAYINQHIALVRPLGRVISRWLARFLAAGPAAAQFQKLNDMGAKAGLNLPAVESLWVALPPREEQFVVSKVLDAIDETIEAEKKCAGKYRLLKSGLLFDLLTGRVRVPEDLLADEGSEAAA